MGGNPQSVVSFAGQPRWWPFLLWLACFYTFWLWLISSRGLWDELAHHWPIAAAMALGSYVAGSTPMGGGTIGFPVLTLLLDEPAKLGRTFSFAVQSIGMTSASIYILARRRPIEWTLLKWAMLGSLVATPLSLMLVAPHIGDLLTKLLFAVIWCSFGIMHFVKLRQITRAQGFSTIATRYDRHAGLAVGVLGGVSASITGVGIDMILYAALVLLYRADLKIAIPTSVIIMAFTSLVGIATMNLLGRVEPGVFGHWIAAAPIVILGAPFGALVVNYLRRGPTLVIVSILCVGQFFWTLHRENVTGAWLAGALLGVLVFNAVFHVLNEAGARLQRRNGSRPAAQPAPIPPIASPD